MIAIVIRARVRSNHTLTLLHVTDRSPCLVFASARVLLSFSNPVECWRRERWRNSPLPHQTCGAWPSWSSIRHRGSYCVSSVSSDTWKVYIFQSAAYFHKAVASSNSAVVELVFSVVSQTGFWTCCDTDPYWTLSVRALQYANEFAGFERSALWTTQISSGRWKP